MPTLNDAANASTEVAFDSAVDYALDEDLRTIAIPARGVVAGTVGDKDVNTIRFQCPRTYKGVDLSGFSCHVTFQNASGDQSAYIVDDVSVSGDLMTFSWLVSALACAAAGNLRFSVNFTELSGSDVKRRYGSTIATATVLENIDSDEVVDADARSDLMALLDSRTQDALAAAKTANDAADAAAKTAGDAARTATDTANAAASDAERRTATAAGKADDAAAAASKAASDANLAAETAKSSAKANASTWLDYDPEGYLCIYESEGD